MKNYKWVVIQGCPRSGTTALANLMNSHESIGITFEKKLLKQKLDRENLEKLYQQIFNEKENIIYFGDKFPDYCFEKYFKLVNRFPGLKIMHISRNPINTINSMLGRTINAKKSLDNEWNKFLSLSDMCAYWIRAWNFINKNKNSDILHIKYEDLVNSPEEESKKISSFLCLENEFNINLIKKRDKLLVLSENQINFIKKKIPLTDDWNLPLENLMEKYPKINNLLFDNLKIRLKILADEII